MKKVFSNKQETAHAWASRSQSTGREGSNARIFFEGDTIYSFGNHFPIAAFFDRKRRGKEKETVVFFTTRDYSPTTSAHKWAVRSAASHYKMIYCLSPIDALRGIHVDNMNAFEVRAHAYALKLARATKPEKYLSGIASIRAEASAYAEFFGLSLRSRKFKLKSLFIESKEQGKKATAEEIKEITAHKKAVEKRRASAAQKEVDDFRNFLAGHAHNSDFTLLRVNSEAKRIETSKGVQIPYGQAQECFALLKDLQGKATDPGSSSDFRGRDIKVFGYHLNRLDSMVFEVGCHKIQFTELDAIATAMGWNTIYEIKGA